MTSQPQFRQDISNRDRKRCGWFVIVVVFGSLLAGLVWAANARSEDCPPRRGATPCEEASAVNLKHKREVASPRNQIEIPDRVWLAKIMLAYKTSNAKDIERDRAIEATLEDFLPWADDIIAKLKAQGRKP